VSGRVLQRLTELGLELPPVVAPVAAYVPAVLDGDRVWTAGQVPMVDGALPVTGKVGIGEGLVPPERANEMARVCALNALAAVASVIDDLDRIVRVVKVVGFVASAPDFTGQPAVINGASELLQAVLGDLGQHARSAVGVAALPMDAPVEVEMVVSIR
jgi:enamine deaminase RidA (YjgF/YER057c/UK114 family)